MVLRKLLSVAVFLVLLTSTAALAEFRQGAVTVSPYVGGYLFEGDQGLNTNNFMCGLGVGYIITDHVGIEGVVGYINSNWKTQPVFRQERGPVVIPPTLNGAISATPTQGPEYDPYRGQVNGYLYKIEGLYHFNPTGKLVPFVAAGFGGLTLDPEQGPGDTTAFFDYGAGVQYFLSNNLAFRADVRHVIAFNEGENNLMYTAALTYYIGGGKSAPAPVAVTPAATRAALKPGGVFAVWGESYDSGFERRLSDAGFKVTTSRPGKGGLRHVVYMAKMQS
jgi:OOP family OmpA-OmpF porin